MMSESRRKLFRRRVWIATIYNEAGAEMNIVITSRNFRHAYKRAEHFCSLDMPMLDMHELVRT